jgi:hypothetical protein
MGGEATDSETTVSGKGQAKKARRLFAMRAVAVGMATFVGGLTYGWWSNRQIHGVNKEEKTTVVATPELPDQTPPSIKPLEKNPAYWSVEALWRKPEDPELSQKIRSLAGQITKAGESMSPPVFWDEILLRSPQKDSSSFEKVLNQLKSSPLDCYSTLENTVGTDWLVVGIHQETKSPGILIRYYFEPLGSYNATTESADWISQSKTLLSIDEFTQSTQDLFAEQSSYQSTDSIFIENPNASNQPPLLFAPRFGYFVVLFEPDSEGISLRDIVSLPGESSAMRLGSDGDSKNRDVLGEYQFDSDRSLARSLLLGKDRDSEKESSGSRREISSIGPPRVRRLAEVAQAALHEPNSTDDRMKRFRKEFTNDFGADALLVSIWMMHYQDKRTRLSFDDFGKVFIEAAHRLFLKTNDPLLLEIKSRIYLAFGKLNESNRALDEAQAAGFESVHLLQRRIEAASIEKDKEKLMMCLRQLNGFVKQKPAAVLNREMKSVWNKQWLDWRAESGTK